MTKGIDFTSQEFFRDTGTGIARLRAIGPLVKIRFPIVGKVWTTTTYELSARVLKDSETFSMRKEGGGLAGLRWWMPARVRTLANSMLTMDEPDHTRLRDIVEEAFRRRAILEMEPRIRAIADDLARELFADGSPADLIQRYARTLPLSVICELLGLPLADRPRFLAWANTVARLSGPISFLRMMQSLSAMKRYLEERLQLAREQGGEGLIADLVRVEMEGGRISADEMISMVFLLLRGRKPRPISSAVGLRTSQESRYATGLRRTGNRTSLALEEFLRFVSAVQFTKPRLCERTLIWGVRLRKGDRIMAMLAAATWTGGERAS